MKTIRGREGSGGFSLHTDGFDTGDGQLRRFDLWQGGENLEVVEPERLVYTFKWDDNPGLSANVETVITITFEEHDGKTTMNFRQAFFVTMETAMGICGDGTAASTNWMIIWAR